MRQQNQRFWPHRNSGNFLLSIMFWIYILKSRKTGCYYIGQTENIIKRLDEHNNRKSRFTKSGVPWELVHSEKFFTRAEVMKREKYLKSLKKRKAIENIIAG